MQEKPKISVISPSKNTGKFLKDTIESVMAQEYKSWEHIIVDGGSTDQTIDILKQYPHVRWISEPDRGPDEAFLKGLAMAKGDYVMLCCISDGYLDKQWFEKCVEILDGNPEISLVWGIDQNMLEDGTMDKIINNSWFDDPPPSGKEHIYSWLKNKQLFLERTMCVRKSVMKTCFPSFDFLSSKDIGIGFLEFTIAFNISGYLPKFVNRLAAYGRVQHDAISRYLIIDGSIHRNDKEYRRKIEEYEKKVISGQIEHRYRDGFGSYLPDKFDVRRYLETGRRNKLTDLVFLLIPPVFPRLINKVTRKYGNYENIKKIRKELESKR